MPDVQLPTGIRLHYEIVGDGEPLLLLPGTGQGGKLWAEQVSVYKSRYRCIMVDNRGAGQSEAPESGYTIRAMAEDASALLDHIGVGRCHVSGQSMGTGIGQELAINWPEKVATLQLHSTWDRPYPHLVRQLLFRRELALREEWELFALNSAQLLFPPAFSNRNPEELQRRQALLFENHATSRGLVGHYDADIAFVSEGRLGAIKAPTLITVGSADLTTLPEYNQRVLEQIPGAVMHVFEGAGHLPFIEQADAFNWLTLGFLAQHPLSAG